MLLGSLPDSYSALITGLESRSENELTLQLVKSKLIDEYKRQKQTDTDKNQNESAMKIDSGQHKKKTRFFCKRDGHYKKECRKYEAWKEKNEKAKQVDEDESCFLMTTPENLKKNEESCFEARGSQKKNNTWFVDLGATSHMASYKECFTEFNPGRKGHVRQVDEQQLCEIKGIGTSIIRCKTDDGNTSNMEI
ncbi:uncharacterized protein LOC124411207 [Diprion similis]|uniref:uncharacterized protein LOC124411207 n=1 Tax=Diprion similis TaxID=362088 RepID=UPI001EF753D6|nr:uncharacterized protein LOC124411207 [Diprion similis]